MLVFLLLPGLVLSDPVLQTSTGKLHGFRKTAENGVESEVFLSVPFAKPPVGDLRFELPVPYEDPDAEVNATQRHRSCPQHKIALNSKLFINLTWSSEDCLYLNIFKPVTNETNLPIVFYIYGGSFLHGSGSFFLYDGDMFATETNVIYVTVNYRVGIFGFFTSGGEAAPGNQGLWDVLEGLRWVKRNARALGGDPDKITIWGQSAGAIVAGIFMSSPITHNLFTRAIMQSGATSTGHLLFKRNSPRIAAKALEKLGCLESSDLFESFRDEAIQCAKKLSMETILSKMAPQGFDLDLLAWQPVFGDELIPVDPFVRGQKLHSAKEILATSVSSEGTAFLEAMRKSLGSVVEAVEDLRFVLALITHRVLEIPVSAASRIAYPYFDDEGKEVDMISGQSLFQRYIGDLLFICPLEYFTTAAEASGISVYRASFEARPSYSPWPSYAVMTHGDDIAITSGQAIGMWKNVKKFYSIPRNVNWNVTTAEVSWTMDTLKLIGEFLHKGKPKIPGSEQEWPLYTKASPQIVYMAPNNFTVVKGPKSDKCGLWEPYIVSSPLIKEKDPLGLFLDSKNSAAWLPALTKSSSPDDDKTTRSTLLSSPPGEEASTTSAPGVTSTTTESINENVIRRGKVLRRTQHRNASDIVSAHFSILVVLCSVVFARMISLT